MLKLVISFFCNVLILLILANILPNFEIDGIIPASAFLLILTLFQWFIVPVLQLLTFPINLLTLGLFGVVINLFSLWVVTRIVDQVTITGSFFEQLLILVLISIGLIIGQLVTHKLIIDDKQKINEHDE